MEICDIDLSQWTPDGGGAVGLSYVKNDNPDLMLKINLAPSGKSALEKEIRNSKYLYSKGMPTPRPICMGTDGQHYGIVFERIPDKVSFARLAGSSSEKQIDALARKQAKMVRKLHSVPAAPGELQDIKQSYREAINRNKFHIDQLKSAAISLLDTLPSGDKIIHGDLHFGNLIRSKSRGDFFIDLGDLSRGDPMFDFGMTGFILMTLKHDMQKAHFSLFHCNPQKTMRFFKTFLSAYFGREVEPFEFLEEIKPYTVIHLFKVENYLGRPLAQPLEDELFSYLLNDFLK